MIIIDFSLEFYTQLAELYPKLWKKIEEKRRLLYLELYACYKTLNEQKIIAYPSVELLAFSDIMILKSLSDKSLFKKVNLNKDIFFQNYIDNRFLGIMVSVEKEKSAPEMNKVPKKAKEKNKQADKQQKGHQEQLSIF